MVYSAYKRLLLVPLICLSIFLSSTAQAVTFKIAMVAPDGTNWMRQVRQGVAEISKRTGGRVKFRFYPGGVMGNDISVLRKIRVGQLQGAAVLAVGLGTVYPDTMVYGLPFMFRSYDEVDYVRKRMDPLFIEGLKDHGFIAFGISETGFAYMMSKQPVRTAADLKPRKVWVPEGDRISLAAFQAIQISPISLPLTDVLTGLQTGLIDTIGSSPVGAIALQWHTQVKHMNDAPLAYLYGTLLIQRKAFEKLSPADQAVVTEVMTAIIERMNRQTRRDNGKATQALERQGITVIHATDAEKKRWQSAVSSAMQRLGREGLYSLAVLRTMQRHLDDYRRNAGGSR